MSRESLTIHLDGVQQRVPAGTTVAAALVQPRGPTSKPSAGGAPAVTARAVRGVTRHSVRGEPRAPACGMGVCQECRVTIDGQRRLSCQTICREGMHVDTHGGDTRSAAAHTNAAQNGAPYAVSAAASPASLAAPFGAVRAATVAPECDLLIIGAGPAGLAAAAAAAPSGARIVIVDDNPAPGGQVWRQGVAASMNEDLRRQLDALSRHGNVAWLSGTRVAAVASGAAGAASAAGAGHAVGDAGAAGATGAGRAVGAAGAAGATGAAGAGRAVGDAGAVAAASTFNATTAADSGPTLLLEDAEGARHQPCRRLLLCTGARELMLPFPGWTLPGVTGAGGLQALVKGGLPVAGQRVVVAGSGPLLLAAAATLRAAGARVLRIAEQASLGAVAGFAAALPRWPGKLVQALALANPVAAAGWRASSWVSAALGDECVTEVHVQRDAGAREEVLACDRLACGFGLVPNVELGRALGCALDDASGALAVDALQRTSIGACFAAGECTGIGGNERARVQGTIAGLAAIGRLDEAGALAPQLTRWQAFAQRAQFAFELRPALRELPRADTLVCRCEDVPHGALLGRRGWIDAKLETRCGMGPCQGRTCSAAAQWLYGWAPPPLVHHLINPVRIASLT